MVRKRNRAFPEEGMTRSSCSLKEQAETNCTEKWEEKNSKLCNSIMPYTLGRKTIDYSRNYKNFAEVK